MNNRKIGFPGNHPLTPWAWIVTAWLVLALAPPALAKAKPSGDSGGGGTDSGTIELVATGAATAFQSCQERLDASTTSYLCNKTVTGYETIQLEQFFQDDVADFDTCFSESPFPVAIGVQVNKDGSAVSVMPSARAVMAERMACGWVPPPGALPPRPPRGAACWPVSNAFKV